MGISSGRACCHLIKAELLSENKPARLLQRDCPSHWNTAEEPSAYKPIMSTITQPKIWKASLGGLLKIRTHQRREGTLRSMSNINGERQVAVTWGQKVVTDYSSNKCKNVKNHHLWHEDPDSKVPQGKTAFEPDCGHQQQEPQQSAEDKNRKVQTSDRKQEASKVCFTLHSSLRGRCETWGRGTPGHLEGHLRGGDNSWCSRINQRWEGACARGIPVGWAARARKSTLEKGRPITETR